MFQECRNFSAVIPPGKIDATIKAFIEVYISKSMSDDVSEKYTLLCYGEVFIKGVATFLGVSGNLDGSPYFLSKE